MLAKKIMNSHYKFKITSIALFALFFNVINAEDNILLTTEQDTLIPEEYENIKEEFTEEDRDKILKELTEKEVLFEIKYLFERDNIKIEKHIQETPLENAYFFIANGQSYIYIRDQHIFIKSEEIIDVKNQKIVNSNILNKLNLENIKEYKENNNLLEYKKDGNENNVFVFFDKTCDYCSVIEARVDTYLNAGINITLIPYPRNGLEGTPYIETLKHWCKHTGDNCNLNVRRGYLLGKKIDITGTPTFVDEKSGKVLSGFRTPKTLIDMYNFK